jgi:uncharacterized membrane protein
LATTPQPEASNGRDLALLADKAILKLATHWLALLNLFFGLYVGLPLLAPLLMDVGWTTPAKIIYTVYRPLCHQRPERSYFLTGDELVYSKDELAAAGVDVGLLSRDIGNETVGWKVAFCERDVAIYGSIFLAGLAYGILRRRLGTWTMPIKVYVIFLVPMGIDGVLQLFGFYESDWIRRTISGAVFGAGSVLFAYPYLEEGFGDVRRSVRAKLYPE